MSDIKELKEKDLNDEELKKVAGGRDLAETLVTCPNCGATFASAWLDLDTMDVGFLAAV